MPPPNRFLQPTLLYSPGGGLCGSIEDVQTSVLAVVLSVVAAVSTRAHLTVYATKVQGHGVYAEFTMNSVVDTCIINKLVDGLIEPEDLPGDGEFLMSHIQIDELNKTKDEERRARLFLKFAKTITQVVPTETTILGVSRLGECKLGDGAVYSAIKAELDSLNGGKANNTMDALIAEVAVDNGYTLLTADFYLSEAAKAHGCTVRYWQT